MLFKDLIKLFLSRSGIRDPFRSLFKEIEFETTSYCNRKCDYCPNADFERFGDQEKFLMKDDVFEVLVKQLFDLKFDGLISPHLYGEPMSDVRILDWCKYIKKKLPSSKLKIVTNGDFLNTENFFDFINGGVDIFYISKHSKLLKKECRDLLKLLNGTANEKYVLVQDFYSDFYEKQTMFNNRGGAVELNKKYIKKPPINCTYATYPVINTLGDLILCCQDFHNNYNFGNIMKNHLRDLWFDKKNITIRKNIYNYKLDLKICRDCRM